MIFDIAIAFHLIESAMSTVNDRRGRVFQDLVETPDVDLSKGKDCHHYRKKNSIEPPFLLHSPITVQCD